MKKLREAFVLAAAVSIVPLTYAMAQTPIGITASYSTDSDGVSGANYSISTEKEDAPWNYSYSHIKIRQRDTQGGLVDENTVTVKWNRPFSDETGIFAWLGYKQNNISNFTPFGVRYQGVVNYTDKVDLSYSHDSVPTVRAYKNHISVKRLSLSYQQAVEKDLMLATDISYARYSDDNFRKTLGVTLTKDFGMQFRLGLAFNYDTSNRNKYSVYYMPKGESSLSLVPEAAFPLGDGILVMTAMRSLVSRNADGQMQKTSYKVGYHLNNLYLGTQFYRDDHYWSHDTSLTFSSRW